MSRGVITEAAAADLKEIRAYLKREVSAEVARNTIRKIREAVGLLRRNPGIGHFREDLVGPAFKVWSVNSYLIIYDHKIRPIEVVRILHASRDILNVQTWPDME